MRNAGIGSWPERRARMSPERDAIWFDGVTTSHAGFAERVRRAASALAGLGVRPGDRVAWFGFNHPAALETLFACAQLGAIWVAVNARLTAAEARYILEHSGSSVVVHGLSQAAVAASLRAQGAVPSAAWVVVEGGEPAQARTECRYEELTAAAQPVARDEPISLDDPCLIMYTSGTTGHPKGAVLTHGNVTWNAVNQVIDLGLARDERTLSLAPLFHIGGLGGTVLPTLMQGGCVVLTRAAESAATLSVIAEQRVTSFFGVPTMLDAIARQPGFDSLELPALRGISVAGAPVPMATLRTWLDRGVLVQQCYGMTEAAPGCAVLPPADAERKIGSAGKAMFFTDLRVVRKDGSQAAVDEVGEIIVSGPNVMAGYWRDPERTAEVLVDGWYHTGDAGSLDEEGFLYIRGRYQDVIFSVGENVYPAEIESALLDLPGVAEAAVIGVPDRRWGETGLAFVVPAPGAEPDEFALRLALRSRLAGFKVPRHIRFVSGLPKTSSGKIRKDQLREQAAAEFKETTA